jgi:NAD-dependent dihydropyrimidine dehydrogenase PreA subunit
MFLSNKFKTIALFLSVIAAVVVLSMIFSNFWGGKPETLPSPVEWEIREGMTLKEFGQANSLPNHVLREIFGLQTPSELQKKLSAYGTVEQIRAMVTKKRALASEHETKNWLKIVIKFALWFVFLTAVFVYFIKRKVDAKIRITTLAVSVFIFGIIMGSDPSPMGTVKDAIHLYGAAGAVFPPRMIALTLFLMIVLIANKYICAWGCQAGVLQDLIFRINQTAKRKAVISKQVKVPFIISNSIRILFLFIFTVVSFLWGLDIIDPIDPFKLFKPLYLTLAGIAFIGVLLITSLFIYRPWCHFFCPFGLVGWLVEKLSRIRISVDYDTCIACQKCVSACPSTVMGAILKQNKKTIPDCFACYTCRDVCPTGSISFSTRKRSQPPSGHFLKKMT